VRAGGGTAPSTPSRTRQDEDRGRQPRVMAGPGFDRTCLLRSVDQWNIPCRRLGDHAGDLSEQGIGGRRIPIAGICDATGEAHRSDCGNDRGSQGFSPIVWPRLRRGRVLCEGEWGAASKNALTAGRESRLPSQLAHAGNGEEEIEDIGPDASSEDSQDSEFGRDFTHRTTPCELEHCRRWGSASGDRERL